MYCDIHADDESATLAVARALGEALACRGVVYLHGTLGAGKTTFCRGILRAYGYEGAVKSPTFTLVEPYDLEWGQVYHFDLYRIADPGELEYLGVDDYLSGEQLCLVEWPERGADFLPPADLQVVLEPDGLARKIRVIGNTERGNSVCRSMSEALDIKLRTDDCANQL